MKKPIYFIFALISFLSVVLSCDDDETKDSSLLVGQWDVRITHVYKQCDDDKEY